MSKPPALDHEAVLESARGARLLAALRDADTDSVKEVAKIAYGVIASYRKHLEIPERDFAIAMLVLQERLLAENRSTINDPDFEIGLESGGSTTVKNDDAILAKLLAVRVDGDGIPLEEIKPAAWIEPPPPVMPIVKTNLTHLKSLAKKYGSAVQDIIDTYVTYVPKAKRLVFQPKEKHVKPTDQPALGDHTTTD